jgi:hypothetical protein
MPLKQRFHPASRQPNSGLPRHCDCRTVCEYSAVRDHCGRGYPRAPDAGQSAAVILKRHPDRFESPRLASSPSKSPRPWRPPIQALEYSQKFRLSPPGGVIASAGLLYATAEDARLSRDLTTSPIASAASAPWRNSEPATRPSRRLRAARGTGLPWRGTPTTAPAERTKWATAKYRGSLYAGRQGRIYCSEREVVFSATLNRSAVRYQPRRCWGSLSTPYNTLWPFPNRA